MARNHRVAKIIDCTCDHCGAPFRRDVNLTKGRRHLYCGRPCNGKANGRKAGLAAAKRHPPISTRFWGRVNKNGPTVRPELGPCWVWTAGTDQYGYGIISVSGKPVVAHRVSWELTNGPIPEGQCSLHKCDNPPCVRPDHLFLGTKKDNVDDAIQKGRHRMFGRPAIAA